MRTSWRRASGLHSARHTAQPSQNEAPDDLMNASMPELGTVIDLRRSQKATLTSGDSTNVSPTVPWTYRTSARRSRVASPVESLSVRVSHSSRSADSASPSVSKASYGTSNQRSPWALAIRPKLVERSVQALKRLWPRSAAWHPSRAARMDHRGAPAELSDFQPCVMKSLHRAKSRNRSVANSSPAASAGLFGTRRTPSERSSAAPVP